MTTRSIETLPTADPINKTAPTGGVNRPIPQFKIIMTPNCMGSIPIAFAIGSNMGVAIRMVHFIDIVYKTSTTLFTLSGMGLFPIGGSCALEGDDKNGSKERVYHPV